jgi:cysteine desulfurase
MAATRPVYMDHQATTPCDPGVIEAMVPYFGERFGNPASRTHVYGWEAEDAVEASRKTLASWIGARAAKEIVFTSGATESNNLALVGAVAAAGPTRRHLVVSAIEHNAVLDPARWLAKRGGCTLTEVPVGADGLVDPAAVGAALRADTLLVSVMHANNEIGTVNPIGEIGALCRERGILFHTDAAQSAGKIPLDVARMHVDLLSISAHKVYGPKGIGALYVRRGDPQVRLEPLIRGGGHERGLRSGTLPVPLIVGLGRAAELARDGLTEEGGRLRRQRDRLLEIIRDGVEDVAVNGSLDARLPGNLNLAFGGLEGEALLVALRGEVAVSSGSACTSATATPSHVLAALGLDRRRIAASLRFGLGRFTTDAEVESAGAAVVAAVRSVRSRTG